MARPAPVSVLVYHPYEAQHYASLVRVPAHRVTLQIASTPGDAARLAGEADVLYAWRFPPALYARATRLRWLQVMGAGVEWALSPELPAKVVVTRAPASSVRGWRSTCSAGASG